MEAPVNQDDKTGEVTTSVEELAIYSMTLSEALYQLLADKGFITRAEVTDRMKKLRSGTKVSFRRPN